MTGLLDLPEEVIQESLLPRLSWKDLLSLRRTCKKTKGITDDYINHHPELTPEIEINGEERSFGAFLDMNIPTTKVFLHNKSGGEFYEKDFEDIADFLLYRGTLVKHLRVHLVSIPHFVMEREFFNALANLQTFEAESYGILKSAINKNGRVYLGFSNEARQAELVSDGRTTNYFTLPDSFRQLQVLKVGVKKDPLVVNVVLKPMPFLEHAIELESVALPPNFFSGWKSPRLPMTLGSLVTSFLVFEETIRQRRLQAPAVPAKLKTIDFASYHAEIGSGMQVLEMYSMRELRDVSMAFLKLCSTCLKNNVRLMNVASYWLLANQFLPPGVDWYSPNLGAPVISLVNLDRYAFNFDMLNLESIEIREISRCWIGRNRGRPYWPSLKRLDINVDSAYFGGVILGRPTIFTYGPLRIDAQVGYSIFPFFFRNICRPALSELRINYSLPDKDNDLVFLYFKDVCKACPNLKKVTLINLPGAGIDKELAELFGGLPELEEICLERCKTIGKGTFVGLDEQYPVFFKLPKLKKLTLKGLDEMPNITDLLFTLVLRHLKLSHLTLTSAAPLTSITPTGILSLLDGSFAYSIEKLSFQDLSLANVTPYGFRNLRRIFDLMHKFKIRN